MPSTDRRTASASRRRVKFPTWEGHDTLVSREVIDSRAGRRESRCDDLPRLFRARYQEFVAKQTPEMKAAVADEDDDAVETIMNERFYHKPEMYLLPGQAHPFLRRAAPHAGVCV